LPIITKLRQEGIEVNDGPAIDRAVTKLWKAVDKGALRSMAIGGRPRRVVRLYRARFFGHKFDLSGVLHVDFLPGETRLARAA